MAVRSPFNFVPLNSKVFYPQWAELVTQDIPFAKGLSGRIDMSIKAETPIFVRNGHTNEDQKEENKTYLSFSKFPDGRFFIPGASVKGTVRSVLEIISMGKMHVDKNAMFAGPRLDHGYKMDVSKVKCGWLLRRKDDTYYISVCKGNPQRIALWEIDRMFGTHIMKDHFSKGSHFNLNKDIKINDTNYDPKTAVFKYALLHSLGKDKELKDRHFSPGENNTYISNEEGTLQGTIVLTGQPNQREQWGDYNPGRKLSGKWKEFIFPTEIDHNLELSTDLFNQYKSLYQDSPDWALRYKDIDTIGMPVFLNEDKNGLVNFGLTFMYKVPYTNVPQDLVPQKVSEETYIPDLAECMFGYTSKFESVRGRVQFSNFVSNDAEEDEVCCLALNGPKASYYPFYIRQDNGRNGFTNHYQNYDNGNLAGRKRYILRDTIWKKEAATATVNTKIRPLKAGCSFHGSIHFHNLVPEELGALLSALTFHGNEHCYHQIGQAKPYGFGKVSFILEPMRTVSYLEDSLRENDFYMACFEQQMKTFDTSWRFENSLKELFTLSSICIDRDDANYHYMEMDMEKNANEFVNIKKERLYLQDYSSRVGKAIIPESILDKYQDEICQLRIQAAKHEKELLRRISEEEIEKKRFERKLKDEEEQKEKEKQRLEAERKQKELEIKSINEIKDRKIQRLKAGLSFLEEIRVDKKDYKVTSFKQAKSKILRWMKDADLKSLPLEQVEQLWISLQRLSKNPDKGERKEWGNKSSKLWVDIISFTSEEIANTWFEELNK